MTRNVQEECQGWPCTGILRPVRPLKMVAKHWELITSQHSIVPEGPSPQPHCCENLKTFTSLMLVY
jgi:hypothetical protein